MPSHFLFNHYHRSGFTAAEVVAVVAVLAIIITVSFPSFNSLRARYILGGDAKLLAADLRYTQQLSVTEQTPYELRLEPVNHSYTIVKLGTPEVIHKTITMDNSVTIVDPTGLTNNQVNFNAAGAPSVNGDIILEQTDGYTATISVRPSGFIKVQ